MLDVGEEGKFTYNDRTITVDVNTLVDIDILGHGHFGHVMLAEVKDGSETIKMAVKVDKKKKTNDKPECLAVFSD